MFRPISPKPPNGMILTGPATTTLPLTPPTDTTANTWSESSGPLRTLWNLGLTRSEVKDDLA